MMVMILILMAAVRIVTLKVDMNVGLMKTDQMCAVNAYMGIAEKQKVAVEMEKSKYTKSVTMEICRIMMGVVANALQKRVTRAVMNRVFARDVIIQT